MEEDERERGGGDGWRTIEVESRLSGYLGASGVCAAERSPGPWVATRGYPARHGIA